MLRLAERVALDGGPAELSLIGAVPACEAAFQPRSMVSSVVNITMAGEPRTTAYVAIHGQEPSAA